MAVVAVNLDTTERKAVAFPPDVIEHARALGRRADSIACADPCALSKGVDKGGTPMCTTTSRCDEIIDFIDRCLAEYERTRSGVDRRDERS